MDIIIQRGKVVKFEELANWSIALDGFVQGPEIDAENHRFSFDHHDKCLRFCTTSACMQAHTAVLMGLDPEKYTVYINDVDLDVNLAIWCLKNPDRCAEVAVEKLVNAAGKLDMHGGAFPTINGMAKTIEWISEPEISSKRNDDYNKLSDEGLLSIMEAVLHRIDLYANNEASIEISKQKKHGEYKILRNENDWVLVESHDPHVFSQLYKAGFDRIVLTRPQTDGSLAVSIAKRSDFIANFPVKKILNTLCELEPGWGGSSSIGGAPRLADGSRSRLSLEQITDVIDRVIKL